MTINVLSLFDGASIGKVALEENNIKINSYFASEIDEHAIKVSKNNHPTIKQVGDVTKVTAAILPKIDLLIGGSPCQGFSIIGKQLNFNDERSRLFFEFVRLLEELKPKYFMLENVKMKKEYSNLITKYLGVEPIEINSNLVSAQNRKRLYWTNIPGIEQPKDKRILLKEVLDHTQEFTELKPFMFGKWGEQRRIDKAKTITAKKANTLTTSRSHTNQYYLNEDKTKQRMLHIHEYETLQTFTKDYTTGVSMTERFKIVGNSWTKDVIVHIFSYLKKELEQ